MKPNHLDKLRAHLLAASFTAMGVEVLGYLALLVLPVPQGAVRATSLRLLAVVIIVAGVIAIRQFARVAFDLAIRSRHAVPLPALAPGRQSVEIALDCPRRWLVIIHLRLTGTPFDLAQC